MIMTAREYTAFRITEIDGELRAHRYYGCRLIAKAGLLPRDTGCDEYAEIARRAVMREAAILQAMGVRRLAPGEGPQHVRR